jgi:hypothetical protein
LVSAARRAANSTRNAPVHGGGMLQAGMCRGIDAAQQSASVFAPRCQRDGAGSCGIGNRPRRRNRYLDRCRFFTRRDQARMPDRVAVVNPATCPPILGIALTYILCQGAPGNLRTGQV